MTNCCIVPLFLCNHLCPRYPIIHLRYMPLKPRWWGKERRKENWFLSPKSFKTTCCVALYTGRPVARTRISATLGLCNLKWRAGFAIKHPVSGTLWSNTHLWSSRAPETGYTVALLGCREGSSEVFSQITSRNCALLDFPKLRLRSWKSSLKGCPVKVTA